MKKTIFILLLTYTVSSVRAQYTVPARTGTECNEITQEKFKVFQQKLEELVALAAQDKAMYGTSTPHGYLANHFYDYAKAALDSATKYVNWMSTNSDGRPSVTTYAEGGTLLDAVGQIVRFGLIQAHMMACFSALYHKSKFASCGIEKALECLAEAMKVITYSSRCYTGGWRDIPPCK